MKKILSILILSILIASMVGCSSNELVKVDGNNTTTQVQEAVGNDDKKHILDSKLVDGKLVVKSQIDYNGDWDFVFKYNLLVIGEIAQGLNLSNIDELQYWSVCQTTDGGTKKIFSCTMGKDQLQMIQDGNVYSTDISNMTSKMTDLYLDSELLQGLSSKVASQIIINDTKEKDHTENIKDTTQTEESEQVVQSKNKTAKKQTKKTNSNTEKNNTTKKVQQKEKNTNNEENNQICAICGEFVPVSDMCERNGKPVHYECIGAKKPGKAIEDEIIPDDESDEDAWINDDEQEFIKYTEDGNTEYYYNGHPVTEEEYNGRKGQFEDSDSINEKIIERNTQTQQDDDQSQQDNNQDE